MTLREFDRLDERERSLWVAEWLTEQTTCLDCRRPVSECSDPKRQHFPLRRICYATMETAAAVAAYQALHENRPFHDGTFTSWAKDRSRSHPYHFADGVKIGVADHDAIPWDEFTTKVNASPVESVGEQSPGEQPEAAEDPADDGDTSD